jgi:hypothetical protein
MYYYYYFKPVLFREGNVPDFRCSTASNLTIALTKVPQSRCRLPLKVNNVLEEINAPTFPAQIACIYIVKKAWEGR